MDTAATDAAKAPAAPESRPADALARAQEVKRPMSAYFWFADATRKRVAEANPGKRLGQIQRLVAAEWKALSAEKRAEFVKLADEDKERFKKELNALGVSEKELREAKKAQRGDGASAAPSGLASHPVGKYAIRSLPEARIRRIVRKDAEVKAIGKEAAVLLTAATEMFAGLLGEQTARTAALGGRRSVGYDDLYRCIRSSDQMAFLRDAFRAPDPAEQSAAEGGRPKRKGSAAGEGKEGDGADKESSTAPEPGARKRGRGRGRGEQPDPGEDQGRITGFFTKRQTRAAAASSGSGARGAGAAQAGEEPEGGADAEPEGGKGGQAEEEEEEEGAEQ